MKAKRINKFLMFSSLVSFMEKNHKIWSNTKEIEKAFKKFYSNNEQLQELKIEIEIDLNKELEKKKLFRQTLIIEAIPVINILRAYSIECKNKKLLKKTNLPKGKLNKMNDLKLSETIKKIWKECRKLYNKSVVSSDKSKYKEQDSKNIRNYGMTGKMVDNLDELNLNYMEAHLQYSDARSLKNRMIKEFESLLKKNDRILKNKLDLLMSIFENSDPDFYKKYVIAHKVEQLKTEKSANQKKTASPEISVKPEEQKIPKNTEIKEKVVIKKAPVKRTNAPVRKVNTNLGVRQRSPRAKKISSQPEHKEEA